MCTSMAPAARSIRTIARVVVPRTIESSTTTRRWPSVLSLNGFSFMRTAAARIAWVGAMKVRPMYRFLTSPWPYGMPLARA